MKVLKNRITQSALFSTLLFSPVAFASKEEAVNTAISSGSTLVGLAVVGLISVAALLFGTNIITGLFKGS